MGLSEVSTDFEIDEESKTLSIIFTCVAKHKQVYVQISDGGVVISNVTTKVDERAYLMPEFRKMFNMRKAIIEAIDWVRS